MYHIGEEESFVGIFRHKLTIDGFDNLIVCDLKNSSLHDCVFFRWKYLNSFNERIKSP